MCKKVFEIFPQTILNIFINYTNKKRFSKDEHFIRVFTRVPNEKTVLKHFKTYLYT